MIKLIFASLVMAQTAWAGLPPTTVKGRLEASPVTTFNVQAPNFQATTVGAGTRLIETGNANLLKNPSFEHSTTLSGWTLNAGTSGTFADSVIDGKKGLSISVTAVTGDVLDQCYNVSGVLDGVFQGQNFEASMFIQTTLAGAWEVCGVIDGVETACQPVNVISGLAGFSKATVYFPGPLSGTTNVCARLKTSAATTDGIVVDSAYLGLARLGTGFADSGWIDGGAVNIVASGGGAAKGPAISNDHFYWRRNGSDLIGRIEFKQTTGGSPTNGSGVYRFVLPTGSQCSIDTTKIKAYTGTDMSDPMSIVGSARVGLVTTAAGPGDVYVYDSSSVALSAGSTNTAGVYAVGGNTGPGASDWYGLNHTDVNYAAEFTVPCAGWTTLTAVPANQTDTAWADYDANNHSQGFGTMTMKKCMWRRRGQNMEIKCDLLTGSVSAVEGRLGLPGSYVTAGTSLIPLYPNGTTPLTASVYGQITRGVPTGQVGVWILAQPGVNFLNVGFSDGSTGGTAMLNANAVVGSSENISWHASVPIEGWQETGRAPELVNSVISSSPTVKNIEDGYVGQATASAVCNSDPCGVFEQSPNVTAVNRTSGGQYVVHFAAGAFRVKPKCYVNGYGNGSSICFIDSGTLPTTTTFSVQCTQPGSGFVDSMFNFTCIGDK